MFQYQKNPLRAVAIWISLFLIGLPLAFLLGISSPLFFAITIVAWLVFCACMGKLGQWLGWRNALILAGWSLAGGLLVLVISWFLRYPYSSSLSLYGLGNLAFSVTFLFLGGWFLLGGLVTRSERGLYVAIHLFNWCFWLGIFCMITHFFPYQLFCIPFAVMLLLLGLNKMILRNLAPLFQKGRQPEGAPKPANPQDYYQDYRPITEMRDVPPPSDSQQMPRPIGLQGYQQGYQPIYEEGEDFSTYLNEEEIPTSYSQHVGYQQQQQHT